VKYKAIFEQLGLLNSEEKEEEEEEDEVD